MNDIPTVSASKLQMFLKCPRQFYNKYVLNLPMKEWTGAVMGSALHETISARLTGAVEHVIPFYLQKYNTAIEETPTVDRYRNEIPMRKAGLDIIRTIPWDRFTPYVDRAGPFVEREFLLPYPNGLAPKVYINGIIDLVTDQEELIDHKSSKDLPVNLQMNIQFMIYHWAYEVLLGKSPRAIYWHHLRTGELFPYAHSTYDFLDSTITTFVSKYGKTIKAFKKKEKDSFCTKVCAFHDRCWK